MNLKKQIANAVLNFYGTNNLIYISGKVTGLEPAAVAMKFAKAEHKLKKLGYTTFNPTAWLKPDADWQDAMKLCIAILPMCDSIALLPDWHESTGAKMEHSTALVLGIPTLEL